MGLDMLDLIFRVEKQFGIRISQAEGMAVFGGTAGMIHRYLVARLKGEYQETPDIQPLFREVTEAVRCVAKRWRLSADLNRRFPAATRGESWRALENALGITLPPLEQPADEALPRIPRQCDSIVSLTYWIVEHHPERLQWIPVSCARTGDMADRQWSDEEVWTILRECISDALGVSADQVACDSRMIEDLGME